MLKFTCIWIDEVPYVCTVENKSYNPDEILRKARLLAYDVEEGDLEPDGDHIQLVAIYKGDLCNLYSIGS